MKIYQLSLLVILFACLAACTKPTSTVEPETVASSAEEGSPVSIDDSKFTSAAHIAPSNRSIFSSDIINGPGIGPEPNYWACSSLQKNTNAPLRSRYQFFHDNTGVQFIANEPYTFTWQLRSDGSGVMNIANDGGNIPVEQWYINSADITHFSASIFYGSSSDVIQQATEMNALSYCVLYSIDTVVEPADEHLLNDFETTHLQMVNEPDSNTARLLLNEKSEFGVENFLWQCVAFDNGKDLLIGFFADGVGGLYNTQNGYLEGTKTSYTVSEYGEMATITVDVPTNQGSSAIQLIDVIFESNRFFTATYSANGINPLVSCNILGVLELNL